MSSHAVVHAPVLRHIRHRVHHTHDGLMQCRGEAGVVVGAGKDIRQQLSGTLGLQVVLESIVDRLCGG